MTRSPRRRAPRAISTGTAVRPLAEKTIITSLRAEGEVRQDDLGEAGRPLDEHRLALAVGADDLGVERHRQLDDRVEARVRAVAREHLLDRDARVAGAEEVDEAVGGDGVGAPLAGLLDRLGLRRGDAVEHARRRRRSSAPRGPARSCPSRSSGRSGSHSSAVGRGGPLAGGRPAGLARPEVVDDRLRGRRPDAGHAEGHDLEQRVERADAAGGLDLDVRRGVRAHQAQVVVGGAAGREAGRGLDEVGAGGLGQVAGADLLVVGQVGVLEDDLDDRAGRVGDVDDGAMSAWTSASRPDLSAPIWMTMSSSVAPSSSACCVSKTFVAVRWLPCGKPIDRADRDVGAGEDRHGPADVGRPDADRGDVVLGRQPAAVLDERVVELGPQQRVVDRLGDVALGQGVDVEAVTALT